MTAARYLDGNSTFGRASEPLPPALLPRSYEGPMGWAGETAFQRRCPACDAEPFTPCLKLKSGGTDYGRGSRGRIAAEWPHKERRRWRWGC